MKETQKTMSKQRKIVIRRRRANGRPKEIKKMNETLTVNCLAIMKQIKISKEKPNGKKILKMT